jgi:hypothetical protein
LDKGFPREPTFRGIRSLIGSSYYASSSDPPAKPSGPKTRQCGFKRVLHRPVEIAVASSRWPIHYLTGGYTQVSSPSVAIKSDTVGQITPTDTPNPA